jgi:uncharacterized protein YcbX
VRRFRPNILLDCEETGFVEANWAGKLLKIGGVTIKLTVPCPRCIMTTHGFDDLPRDTTIMRALVRECGHQLGIYAEVVNTGVVNVGDEAELIL